MDVNEWLKTLGYPVAETSSNVSVRLPAIMYTEYRSVYRDDIGKTKGIVSKEITLELYAPKINELAEQKIEHLLTDKGFDYTKNRIWLDGERCYMSVYEFEFIEKNKEE